MEIEIKGKKIGEGYPCYITFEAGPTHDGLESAQQLVRLAAEAGADAIKFQILDPDRLVADKKQLFQFDILVDKDSGETKTIERPLYDLLKERSMSAEEWKQVKQTADELGIAFFATVGFEDEVALLQEIGCDSIKIASADVNHVPLLRLAARSGMVIQLDTGNASLGEIEQAVDIIQAEGNERIIIHQCPSGYPARLESIQLSMIKTLKTMFPYPAAFSDHTPGWDMDIAAVVMGADLVEKTITMDRSTPSVEHIMSLEPGEMTRFISAIRDVETAMGNGRRFMTPEQKEKRNSIRRSLFLRSPAKAGTPLTKCDIEFRRPGFGIPPDKVDELDGLSLVRDVDAGEMLHWSDLV